MRLTELKPKRSFFLEMDEEDAHTLLRALRLSKLSSSEQAIIDDTIEQLETFKLKQPTTP